MSARVGPYAVYASADAASAGAGVERIDASPNAFTQRTGILFTASKVDVGELSESNEDCGAFSQASPARLLDLGLLHRASVLFGIWRPARKCKGVPGWARFSCVFLVAILLLLIDFALYLERRRRAYGGNRDLGSVANILACAIVLALCSRFLVGRGPGLQSTWAPSLKSWRKQRVVLLAELVALVRPAQARELGTRLWRACTGVAFAIVLVFLAVKNAYDTRAHKAPMGWRVSAYMGELPYVLLCGCGYATAAAIMVLYAALFTHRARDIVSDLRARSVDDHLRSGLHALQYELHSLFQLLVLANRRMLPFSLAVLGCVGAILFLTLSAVIVMPSGDQQMGAILMMALALEMWLLVLLLVPSAACNAALDDIQTTVAAERGEVSFLLAQEIDDTRRRTLLELGRDFEALLVFLHAAGRTGATFAGIRVSYGLIKGLGLAGFSFLTFVAPIVVKKM
eukprot:a174945_23.p1 GENE.a174945_23~~a174945_23.p1  ORF type:complete len:480 (+),score=69.12 a174945_23:75-1442(+)